jgi:hypothetical protein
VGARGHLTRPRRCTSRAADAARPSRGVRHRPRRASRSCSRGRRAENRALPCRSTTRAGLVFRCPAPRGRVPPGAFYFCRVSRESEVASNETRVAAGVGAQTSVAATLRQVAARCGQPASARYSANRGGPKLRRRRSDPHATSAAALRDSRRWPPVRPAVCDTGPDAHLVLAPADVARKTAPSPAVQRPALASCSAVWHRAAVCLRARFTSVACRASPRSLRTRRASRPASFSTQPGCAHCCRGAACGIPSASDARLSSADDAHIDGIEDGSLPQPAAGPETASGPVSPFTRDAHAPAMPVSTP